MSDYTIIKKLKLNNEKAIDELIGKYGLYIGAVIFGVSRSSLKAEDIEEIASDVFYAVWKKRHEILQNDSLKPYLAQIARNMTINKFNQIKNFEPLDEQLLIFDIKGNDEILIQQEKIAIIKEFLDIIKHPDKDILVAYYFKNDKLENIAETYKLPLSTVKSKIYRGRKSIVEYFEKRGYRYEN